MCNNELIEMIYRQINKSVFNESSNDEVCMLVKFKEYLIDDIKGDYISLIDEQLENKRIVFKGKTFTTENKKILDKLSRIKFIDNCIFEFDFLLKEEKVYSFVNCTFNSKLYIKNCSTFDSNALFNNCKIKDVFISSTEINIKLFDFCTIKKLKAEKVIFKKEVFFDTLVNYIKINNPIHQSYQYLTFIKCKFEDIFFIGKYARLDSLILLDCIFFNELNLKIIHPITKLKIKFCNFKEKFDISGNIVEDELCIENSTFYENITLDKTISDALFLKNNIFTKLFSMPNSKMKFSIFDGNSFNVLNLRKTEFEKLDLEKTAYIGKSDFSGVIAELTNRETARIIKDSFEQQNNIIEANKFYAIEMQKREEELKPSKDFFEWLVFKIYGLSSNHSQDWTLSLAWIILFGMLLTVFKVNLFFDINIIFCIIPLLYVKIEKYMFLVFYGFYLIFMKSLDKSPLDNFATNINPFSIMTSTDSLTFIELIFKIVIAFLIYQFIISIRQNTRRK